MIRIIRNVYVLMGIIMIFLTLFLSWAVNSPFSNILLPINIPLKFDIRCTSSMHPQQVNMMRGDHDSKPYSIVLTTRSGEEQRFDPRDSVNSLIISDLDLGGTAYLGWSNSSKSLKIQGGIHESEGSQPHNKQFNVILKGPFSTNPTETTTLQINGDEGAYEGIVESDESSSEKSISFKDFNYTFTGYSIPIGDKSETGLWKLITYPDSPVKLDQIKGSNIIKLTHVSFFYSPNLFAEDLVTKQKMPIPFETVVTGSFTPSFSDLPDYIQNQIYLQVFGWLAPVGVLLLIFWVDKRYRRKIKQYNIGSNF